MHEREAPVEAREGIASLQLEFQVVVSGLM